MKPKKVDSDESEDESIQSESDSGEIAQEI
jgi:hypothetical protein